MATKQIAWWEVLEALGPTPQQHGIRRINLVGPPGTGKSTAPHRMYGQCEQAHLTEDSGPEDLLGMYSLQQGSTQFVDGPASRAFRAGRPLVIEEIDRGSASTQSILHAVLDDAEIAAVNLPTGERLTPSPNYLAIGTMNGRACDLDEPIADRFDLTLLCYMPHPGILQRMSQALAAAVQRHYAALALPPMVMALSARNALAFTKLARPLGESVAAQVIWGSNSSEMLNAIAASA